MTLTRATNFTTYLTATLLEREFNNIYARFGAITNGDIDANVFASSVDYYVGDPTDDLATNIASAVTADRPLFLPAGTYVANDSNATCTIPDNFIIVGAGIDRTIITEKTGNTEDDLLTTDGVNVLISDLTIKPNSDMGSGGHNHNLSMITIAGSASTNLDLRRIKFDSIGHTTSNVINAIKVSALTDVRTLRISECHFYGAGSYNSPTGYAIHALGRAMRLFVSDSVFRGWYGQIVCGSTALPDAQTIDIRNCYFELMSDSSDFTALGIYAIGGGCIQGNVFNSSISIAASSAYYIKAENDGDTIMHVINNLMTTNSYGPYTGVILDGDNIIVIDLIEPIGSAGFTSGLMSITGLDTTAVNCWWDGIHAVDSTKEILPSGCTKADSRPAAYGKYNTSMFPFQLSEFPGIYDLNIAKLHMYYTGSANQVRLIRRDWIWQQEYYAYLPLTGATNIAD